MKNLPALDADVWDLYDTRKDFSLANNLAAQNPDRLKELKALFEKALILFVSRNHTRNRARRAYPY